MPKIVGLYLDNYQQTQGISGSKWALKEIIHKERRIYWGFFCVVVTKFFFPSDVKRSYTQEGAQKYAREQALKKFRPKLFRVM